MTSEIGGELVRPSAFISYAHADPSWSAEQIEEWRTTILEFATLLCTLGIDAEVDQFYEHSPDVDWNRFGVQQAQDKDFVLIATSPAYRDRWEGRNVATEGAGAVREADELMGQFNADQERFQRRVKIVLLPGASGSDVPAQLNRLQRFRLDHLTEDAVEDLYRTLTGQPATPKPELGPLRRLSPRTVGENQRRALAEASKPEGGARAKEVAQLRVDLARVEAGLESLPDDARALAERGSLHLPSARAARQLDSQHQAILDLLAELESEGVTDAGTTSPGALSPSEAHSHETAQEVLRPDVLRLVKALADADGQVRFEAMSALRERLTPELLGVVEELLDDRDNYIRQMAVEYYAELTGREGTERLVKALADADGQVRFEAMSALRERLTPELLGVVEELLDDRDNYIRQMAVEYYAELTGRSR